MRTAYITTEDLAKGGGGKVHFWAIASELQGLGHTVRIVSPRYGAAIAYPPGLAGTSWRVPGKSALGLLWFEIALAAWTPWARLKHGQRAWLIRGGGPCLILGLVMLWARAWGIRVVLECNGVAWEEMKARGFRPAIVAFTRFAAWQQAAAAHVLVSVTPAIGEAYVALARRSANRVHPISNGAFPNPAGRARVAAMDSGDAPQAPRERVFIMASSFTPWHGVKELIDAAAILRSRGLNAFRIVLIGDGETYAAAVEQVRQLALGEYIELTGRLPHDEVQRRLVGADAGLFLCTDEGKLRWPGSPLKLFEYWAAGLAAVAPMDSYHGPMNDEYGFGRLVASPSAESVAETLAQLITLDERSLIEIRQRNLDLVDAEFTWRQVAERVSAVLAGRKPKYETWLRRTPWAKEAHDAEHERMAGI